MANPNKLHRNLIEGHPVLVVIDILESAFIEQDVRSIDHMSDYADRMAKARIAVDKARQRDIPVIFIQEVHRPDLLDFGRELDGDEDVHCIETNPTTAVAKQTGFLETDILVRKRRYSAFFGTDFEIMLRALNVDTLLLCGGLTDVCVHYTFVDAHQSDYFCRVIEDCVAGSSQDAHEHALRAMEYLQSGARRSLPEVLEAMDSYQGAGAFSVS
ncbi:MAG: cysteine hydrolase [Acidimicrobiales bacterium]|nr:cysteine hydrolase [Acidimicrobiales bacterium]